MRELRPNAIFEIYTIGKPLSIRGYVKVRGTLTSKATTKDGSANSYALTYDRKFNRVGSTVDTHVGTNKAPIYTISEDLPYAWNAGQMPSFEGGLGIDKMVSNVEFNKETYRPSIGFRMPELEANAESSSGGDAETTFDVNAQIHLVVKGAPALSAGYDMASYIKENGGTLPFSFRDSYMDRYSNNHDGNGLWFSGNAENGAHSYLAIHSLGKSKLSAEQVMDVCKKSIGTVFPGGIVDMGSPTTVLVANHSYKLSTDRFRFLLSQAKALGIIPAVVATGLEVTETLPPQVECTEASSLRFTFKAKPKHVLVGTALHGVFKDSNGELWMCQQGRGTDKELAPRLAYFAAHQLGMWSEMASNLRRAIGN